MKFPVHILTEAQQQITDPCLKITPNFASQLNVKRSAGWHIVVEKVLNTLT